MIDVSGLLGDLLKEKKVKNGDEYFLIERSNLLPAMIRLEKEFSFFSECVGVDYSTWTHERDFSERFEVVYNLMSPKTAQRIFVKTSVDDGQTIPSMIPVYQGAEYPEKEISDLFGIRFLGNELTPGTRFILPDDWTGFPLRKEYPLGGEDVLFDKSSRGPAIEDKMMPHAGESFEGNTGTDKVSGR